MALTFTSSGCDTAVSELNASITKLDKILDNLEEILGEVKTYYKGEGADSVYQAFGKINEEFPYFRDAVKSCSNYLSDTVKPYYANLESKINNGTINLRK